MAMAILDPQLSTFVLQPTPNAPPSEPIGQQMAAAIQALLPQTSTAPHIEPHAGTDLSLSAFVHTGLSPDWHG